MEPLHITEFASKRYYEKLEQLPKEHEQQQQAEGHVVVDKASTFILPIRQAEHQAPELPWHGEHQRLEKKEKEKGRLFGRLRASKASASASESQPLRRPSVGSITSSNPLRESPAVKRKRYSPNPVAFLALPGQHADMKQSTVRSALFESANGAPDSNCGVAAFVRRAQLAASVEVVARHGDPQ